MGRLGVEALALTYNFGTATCMHLTGASFDRVTPRSWQPRPLQQDGDVP
jgi:hypothetical protein